MHRRADSDLHDYGFRPAARRFRAPLVDSTGVVLFRVTGADGTFS